MWRLMRLEKSSLRISPHAQHHLFDTALTPYKTMAAGRRVVLPLHTCLRCIRQNINSNACLTGAPSRLFSSSTPSSEQAQVEQSPKFPELDPSLVSNRRDERRLIRTTGVLPIGSRRRRAALQTSSGIPFEQLPYQCFQEARKVLQADREEKIKQIEVMRSRIANVQAQDAAVSGGEKAKEARLRSMRNYVEELKILADINDPMVKKRHEDREGMKLSQYVIDNLSGC